MKVLIVKVSALGDIVHALPVLAHLHAVQPGISVDWLVENSFAPLLKNHPLLRKVVHLDTRGWRRQGSMAAIKGSWMVGRQLREEAYDVLRKAEEAGLVHMTSNLESGHGYICNCCGCCCGFLKMLREQDIKAMLALSNFQVVIDEAGHDVIAVVIARLPAQRQRDSRFLAGFF